jgi:hypothetical protein
MFHPLLTLAFFACFAAAVGGGEPARSDSAWGTVAGRVVFDGDLADPAVRKREADLRVDARIAIGKSVGENHSQTTDLLPNLSLLIDAKTRGVANAIVYIRRKPDRIHPSFLARKIAPRQVTYDRGLLSPRTLIIEVGQPVCFNSREEAVNLEVEMDFNRPINQIVTPEGPLVWTPRRREAYPLRVGCNFRPTALGYWLVVDHPYAALTTFDGSFRIEKLPAGELDLTIWHEAVGFVEKKLHVTVPAGRVELPPVAITLERLKKP